MELSRQFLYVFSAVFSAKSPPDSDSNLPKAPCLRYICLRHRRPVRPRKVTVVLRISIDSTARNIRALGIAGVTLVVGSLFLLVLLLLHL